MSKRQEFEVGRRVFAIGNNGIIYSLVTMAKGAIRVAVVPVAKQAFRLGGTVLFSGA